MRTQSGDERDSISLHNYRTENWASIPSGATSPEMLDAPVAKERGDFKIEAVTGLQKAENFGDGSSGHVSSKGRTLLPGLSALVIAPPVFDGAVDGNTQFVVALQGFVAGTEFALDHDGRSLDVTAELFRSFPNHAVGIIAPVTLHGAVVIDANDVEPAIAALNEGGSAECDVTAKNGAFNPRTNGVSAAPPMREFAVLGANDNFKVPGRVIVTLNETGNTMNVVGTEDSAVVPRFGVLVKVPVMETMRGGREDDFKVAVEGGALGGG